MTAPLSAQRPKTAQERAERNLELMNKLIKEGTLDTFHMLATKSTTVPGLFHLSEEVDGFISTIMLIETTHNGYPAYKVNTIVTKIDPDSDTAHAQRVIIG